MKKLLVAMLTVTLALGSGFLPTAEEGVNFGRSVVITASAAEVSDDYEYEDKSDGTVEITEYTGEGGNVAIPDTIDGNKVTSIGYGVFSGCESLTSITIPDSVTSIGDYAFFDCESLSSITIPDSVTSIGEGAFDCCESLTSITIPDSVTSIGYGAFDCCESLTSITIPDSVTSIGYGVFSGCESLTSITIPDSVTSIGYNAFGGCESLTSITIPASVTSIGESAFESCDGLEDVYYAGTKSQWNRINVEQYGNECLRDATLHCTDGSHTHAYTSKETTKPTCTKAGVKTYTCSCGNTYKEEIPAINHKYSKVTVKPTLTKTGYTAEKCSACGAIRNKKTIAKLINISKVKVTGLTSKYYTGKQIRPAVTVTYGKTKLKANTDYTISYGTNKAAGKGSVTISGKGKYGGKITKTFSILPRKTAVSVKSTKRGKLSFTVTKRSEATKYQIQYATNSKFKSAKTLTTTSLKPVVSASSKKTHYVRVRTVKTVGKTNYYSGWSSVKKIKVK